MCYSPKCIACILSQTCWMHFLQFNSIPRLFVTHCCVSWYIITICRSIEQCETTGSQIDSTTRGKKCHRIPLMYFLIFFSIWYHLYHILRYSYSDWWCKLTSSCFYCILFCQLCASSTLVKQPHRQCHVQTHPHQEQHPNTNGTFCSALGNYSHQTVSKLEASVFIEFIDWDLFFLAF